MRDPREQTLLAQLQAGEDGALDELARTYGPKIYQLAFRYLRNKEDAGSGAGRALQGAPERPVVPGRRGLVVLDLSHHLQHRDVAHPHRPVSADAGRRSADRGPRRSPAVSAPR